MKDHEKRELVSELVGIASIAHGTEQLRDRIAYALSGVFSAIDGVTGRADKAESELAKLRDQEPVAIYDGVEMSRYTLRWTNGPIPVDTNLYTNPIPAPAVPYGVDEEAANHIALAVYDCKHGINQEPLLYAINRILVTEAHPLSTEGQRALLQSAPTGEPK